MFFGPNVIHGFTYQDGSTKTKTRTFMKVTRAKNGKICSIDTAAPMHDPKKEIDITDKTRFRYRVQGFQGTTNRNCMILPLSDETLANYVEANIYDSIDDDTKEPVTVGIYVDSAGKITNVFTAIDYSNPNHPKVLTLTDDSVIDINYNPSPPGPSPINRDGSAAYPEDQPLEVVPSEEYERTETHEAEIFINGFKEKTPPVVGSITVKADPVGKPSIVKVLDDKKKEITVNVNTNTIFYVITKDVFLTSKAEPIDPAQFDKFMKMQRSMPGDSPTG